MICSDSKLKQLREENEKLKRIVADLTLDKVRLQNLNTRKRWAYCSVVRRCATFMSLYGSSERRACTLTGLNCTACRYKPHSEPQKSLHQHSEFTSAIWLQTHPCPIEAW